MTLSRTYGDRSDTVSLCDLTFPGFVVLLLYHCTHSSALAVLPSSQGAGLGPDQASLRFTADLRWQQIHHNRSW
jgi:hypothetical protein